MSENERLREAARYLAERRREAGELRAHWRGIVASARARVARVEQGLARSESTLRRLRDALAIEQLAARSVALGRTPGLEEQVEAAERHGADLAAVRKFFARGVAR